jgi:hypothetical protein
MRLFELAVACYCYGVQTGFDKGYREFLSETQPRCDVTNEDHRKSLLKWLNAWGCRQFARQYHAEASRLLADWAARYLSQLPPPERNLLSMSDEDIDKVGTPYEALCRLQASSRQRKSGASFVEFGPTGAAKILFAFRKEALPPWDFPIRKEYNWDGSAHSYLSFLRQVRREIEEVAFDAAGHRIPVEQLPTKLQRPLSSVAKLVDEYYWMKATKGWKPLSVAQIKDWSYWSRSTAQREVE